MLSIFVVAIPQSHVLNGLEMNCQASLIMLLLASALPAIALVWRKADIDSYIEYSYTKSVSLSSRYILLYVFKHLSIAYGTMIAASSLIDHNLGECRILLQSSMAG